jgi:hypothetical protein
VLPRLRFTPRLPQSKENAIKTLLGGAAYLLENKIILGFAADAFDVDSNSNGGGDGVNVAGGDGGGGLNADLAVEFEVTAFNDGDDVDAHIVAHAHGGGRGVQQPTLKPPPTLLPTPTTATAPKTTAAAVAAAGITTRGHTLRCLSTRPPVLEIVLAGAAALTMELMSTSDVIAAVRRILQCLGVTRNGGGDGACGDDR